MNNYHLYRHHVIVVVIVIDDIVVVIIIITEVVSIRFAVVVIVISDIDRRRYGTSPTFSTLVASLLSSMLLCVVVCTHMSLFALAVVFIFDVDFQAIYFVPVSKHPFVPRMTWGLIEKLSPINVGRCKPSNNGRYKLLLSNVGR